MDLRSLIAQQGYGAARPASSTPESAAQTGPAAAARDFTTALRESEATAKSALAGQADPEALVQALAETQLAVETAVTVRDRVVEAYQEILRMPV